MHSNRKRRRHPRHTWARWELRATSASAPIKESEMSTDFRLLQRVRACDLFDGRLEEFNVREHFNPTQTTKQKRCLTDGRNYLWVFMDDDDFVSSLTRWAP